MPLYEIQPTTLQPIERSSFESLGLGEREDLQRLLRGQIDVICPGALVISEEFGEWDGSRRRIDLLCLDRDGTLVVVELKRTESGGHMELQAIRYAAMVSTMTLDQAAAALADGGSRFGSVSEAHDAIVEHLEAGESTEAEFGHSIRIVLVSADFDLEISTTALWLNDQGLDISCVRLVPYQHGDTTLLDVQQAIPLPEAEQYQVRVRTKAAQERAARSSLRNVYRNFWSGLLERARGRVEIHDHLSPPGQNYLYCSKRGISYAYAISRGVANVAVWLARSEQEENDQLCRSLYEDRSAIYQELGAELDWAPELNSVRLFIPGRVNLDDTSTWPETQETMIRTMEKFVSVLLPRTDQLVHDLMESERST